MLISLTDLEGHVNDPIVYDLGQVICHRLYGYRAVIVSCDPRCMAGDTWYFANKTQPARDQPWYHVLVHDSGGLSTYVAQSNLYADETGNPVVHPRLNTYFSEFKDGRYILREKATDGGCGI